MESRSPKTELAPEPKTT